MVPLIAVSSSVIGGLVARTLTSGNTQTKAKTTNAEVRDQVTPQNYSKDDEAAPQTQYRRLSAVDQVRTFIV